MHDEQLLQQRLINQHLINPKYKLVTDWREYEHSSAGFYEPQQVKHFAPVHYEELK